VVDGSGEAIAAAGHAAHRFNHLRWTDMAGKAERTWLLIADGGRAKVLETDDHGRSFQAIDDMAQAIELPRSRDILADRPGRTFDSVGSGRHAKENPSDPHRQLKREFARTMAGALRHAMLAKRFDRLILVAPPVFMGDLRAEFAKDLKDKVADEVLSDLTNIPQQDLLARLRDILGREA
jgi:protein required for attachment to host cells